MSYDPDTDSADIARDARYEAMAERDDFDNFEADRAQNRYESHLWGDR
jgi:hypothetical protein